MRPAARELVRRIGENGPGAGGRRGDRPNGNGLARRVFLGGLFGGLPGLLLALVPMLLHDLGLITSDQSQIGFVGVPLLFLGVFVGTAIGAADRGCDSQVMIGVAAGFGVGVVGGLAIAALLLAVGVGVGGLWLLVAAASMIAGGVLAARRCADRGLVV